MAIVNIDLPILGDEGTDLYLVIIPAENPLEDETYLELVRADSREQAGYKVAVSNALTVMEKQEWQITLIEEKINFSANVKFEMAKPMIVKYLGVFLEVSTENNIPL